MFDLFIMAVTRGAATPDGITWTQVNVLLTAASVLVALVSIVTVVWWRGQKEFNKKIDKLDEAIEQLTQGVTDWRLASVTRVEVNELSGRLLKVELKCERGDANIGAHNERLDKLEENYGT